MKPSSRDLNILIYFVVFILGAGLASLPVLRPHSENLDQSLRSETHQIKTHETGLSNPLPIGNSPALKLEATTGGTASSTKKSACLQNCAKAVRQLLNPTIIDDKAFDDLSALTGELAVHLEKDELARLDMLTLAMTTGDHNKRNFITDVFSLLPQKQREALGEEFAKSSDWRIRVKGVQLSSKPEDMTPSKAESLVTKFSQEKNNRVKNVILDALKNAGDLKGNHKAIDHLSSILSSETDSRLKAKAMLTKLSLQNDPLDSMPDALMALASKDPEFQVSALMALERIYETDHVINGTLDKIDHLGVQRMLEDLLEMEITPENESSIGRLLKEADAFYIRHF